MTIDAQYWFARIYWPAMHWVNYEWDVYSYWLQRYLEQPLTPKT